MRKGRRNSSKLWAECAPCHKDPALLVGWGGGKAVTAEAGRQTGSGPWRPWSHAAELGLHSAICGSHFTFCEEKTPPNTELFTEICE